MGVGHRRRTVVRVLQTDNVYGHDLLESLLYNVCPRKDMNDCAKNLLAAFGSVENVLSADVEQLTAVDGVGANVAEYIRIIGLGLKNSHGGNIFGVAVSTYSFRRFALSQNRVLAGDLLELYAVDCDGRIRMILPVKPNERNKGDILKKLLPAKAYGIFVLRCREDLSENSGEDALVDAVKEACLLASVRVYDYCVKTENEFYSYFTHDKLSGDRV